MPDLDSTRDAEGESVKEVGTIPRAEANLTPGNGPETTGHSDEAHSSLPLSLGPVPHLSTLSLLPG